MCSGAGGISIGKRARGGLAFARVAAEAVDVAAFAAFGDGVVVAIGVAVEDEVALAAGHVEADAHAVVHGEAFGEIRPASTMVVVRALLDPRWKVEVEVEAVTET